MLMKNGDRILFFGDSLTYLAGKEEPKKQVTKGYTRIVDRKKDMIIVSGFNVFPNELENVISLCPGVVECAAIGIPDDKTGEAIKVFVVKSDAILTEEDVSKYCRQNMTAYKIPKYIEFRDDLPKTNVGKILRRELRAGK